MLTKYIHSIIPGFIKHIIKFCIFKAERRKVFREIKIRRIQNLNLENNYNSNLDNLIIFLVVGANGQTGIDEISGGTISIASIYENTKKIKHIHNSEVCMVTPPKANLLLRHTMFPNNIDVYRFEQLTYFSNVKKVIVHIPELMFNEKLISLLKQTFHNIDNADFHFNILNQRIDIMPSPDVVKKISNMGFKVTQTTAHEQYSTQNIRDKFAIPLHKFSVFATPERYTYTKYSQKKNIILISPDENDNKKKILAKIASELSHFEIKIIQDITYMKYLDLIKQAKYMITFGEGLDFYFVETVFSGGVSFSVYNDVFFTAEFHKASGILENYELMENNIVNEIVKLENEERFYKSYNKEQFTLCHSIYNEKDYLQNIMNFYKENYLFS